MSQPIRVNLNKNSLFPCAERLERYQDELQVKMNGFMHELLDIGEKTIDRNRGVFGSHLRIKSWVTIFKSGVRMRGNIVLSEKGTIPVTWRISKTNPKLIRRVRISPLMMTEYGSGNFAVEGHQGTFSIYGHGNQPSWTWLDMNGEEHESSGFVPQRPMHKASLAMRANVQRVARRHF